MKATLICFFLVLLIAIHTNAGQIITWTDEDGVTHIEYVTNKSNYESNYKSKIEAQKVRLKIEQEKRDDKQKRIMEENSQKLENYKRNAQRKIADERAKIEQDLERKKLEREIESAKKEYEYEKGKEEEYRENYNAAFTDKYKRFWRKKIDGIYEAQKKYEALKHRQFEMEN